MQDLCEAQDTPDDVNAAVGSKNKEAAVVCAVTAEGVVQRHETGCGGCECSCGLLFWLCGCCQDELTVLVR